MQRTALPRNGPQASDADASNPLGAMEATLSCLWVLTPLTATVSLLVVIIAMFTNQWLHTEEKMNNLSYNGTGEKDYLSKFTISGLWMLCFTNPGETLFDCSKIDYFSKEEYSPDPNDSTMAIPYTVTRSVAFFLVASLLLCGGYCCCLLGHCVRQRTLYTFISGVIFIVTGLVMLFGLIMYISVFKAEIGSKLRPKSQLQPPAFDYWYGYSFLLYVSGLITTQLAGISSIFLFIYKVQYEFYRKHLEEERSGIKTRPPPFNSYNHALFYPCRRHPQAYVNSTAAIQFFPPTQRRYFFSREPLASDDSPCSIHRPHHHHHHYHHHNSVGGSLHDLAGDTVMTPSSYDFPPPPPPTISYRFLPRDATTNTVSTTADEAPPFDDDFVSFDLDDAPLPMRAQSSVSIGSKFECETLRRTTPV